MNDDKKTFQIKKIVCPTDLSFESFASIDYAAQIAEIFGATLYLCHYQTAAWHSELPEGESIEKINLRLESLINEKRFERPVNWHLVIIEGAADPARCIAAFANEMDCDLIVTRPRNTAFRNKFCGSLMQKLIQISPCPVLLLPPGFSNSEDSRSEFKVEKILLNYSFSPQAEKFLDYAIGLTRALDSELHILAVLAPPEKMSVELAQIGAQQDLGKKMVIEKIAEQMLHHAPCPVIPAVRTGNSQSEMAVYVSRYRIDMVCMIAPENHFCYEYLFPVWFKQIQNNVNVPVLVWNKGFGRKAVQPVQMLKSPARSSPRFLVEKV
jgi:nucleotide-binding universal stress UspA family protein